MKTPIIAITLALALSGCSDREQIEQHNEKIKSYENRFIQLENRLSVMEDSLKEITASQAKTNALFAKADQSQRRQIENLSEAWNRLDDAVKTNLPAIRYNAAVTAATKPESKINGVPKSVYDQILAAARQEYPTDFSMQEYQVRRQLEAWKKLNP